MYEVRRKNSTIDPPFARRRLDWKTWGAIPLLTLALACPGEPGGGTDDNRPLTYDAVLAPTQITAPAGGLMWGITAKVVRQPDGAPVDLRPWATSPQGPGHFKWEILDPPQGADGGRFFARSSGTLLEAMNDQSIGLNGLALLQGYFPPSALPQGTTGLNLKVRITITPPEGSPVAQAEIPLVIEPSAL